MSTKDIQEKSTPVSCRKKRASTSVGWLKALPISLTCVIMSKAEELRFLEVTYSALCLLKAEDRASRKQKNAGKSEDLDVA